ncbi:MAG TPA: hypothetical protein VKT75_15710 [Acidobacteriaceae bacterium]|nr:hypothetical protein [Acidobacteriaceae bacterium]
MILRLPDLEHARTAVLNSLTNTDAQRGYWHAIDEFVDWYCSEPRLAFNPASWCGLGQHCENEQTTFAIEEIPGEHIED